jgi:hypothetical protein
LQKDDYQGRLLFRNNLTDSWDISRGGRIEAFSPPPGLSLSLHTVHKAYQKTGSNVGAICTVYGTSPYRYRTVIKKIQDPANFCDGAIKPGLRIRINFMRTGYEPSF